MPYSLINVFIYIFFFLEACHQINLQEDMSPIMALNQITLVSTDMLELKPIDFSCGRLINSGHEGRQKGGELDFLFIF